MLQTLAKAPQLTKSVLTQNVLKCTAVKCISNRSQDNTEKQNTSSWITIYKLPLIGQVAALSKIKLYQAGFTALAIPASCAAESAALISEGSSSVISALGITGTMTLFITSYLTQNLIGFIYVDHTKTHIRMSYIDFWGRRKNIELESDEIDTPSEELKFGVLSTVRTKKQSYKLLRRAGQVYDPNVFAHFFGE